MNTGTRTGTLCALLIATTMTTGCSNHLSNSAACGKAAKALNDLDATLRTIANRTATIGDVAPTLKSQADKLHDIANRSDGDVAQTIERLSVDVARVRTDALNHQANSADAAALGSDDARLQQVCPGDSIPR